MSLIRHVLVIVFAILALVGRRWAYFAFVVASLSYFAEKANYHLRPLVCELSFTPQLAAFSLRNFPHIILFAIFFIFTVLHARASGITRKSSLTFAAIATLVMGALVELGEGLSGSGHCRMRDLIPDTAGLLLGATAILLWYRVRSYKRTR